MIIESPGAYFLTLCTSERKNYFWEKVGATIGRPKKAELSFYGKIVDEAISDIPKIYSSVTVDHYVIMPDHIHLLLTIHSDEFGRPMVAPTIERIIKQFKGFVTKRLGVSIWQKLFFDHVIRNKSDYDEHAKYIEENPSRWYYAHFHESIENKIGVCNECGSEFFNSASKMSSLCPECAHILYGYENCKHIFENGRCMRCGWNGNISEYMQKTMVKN